MDTHVPFLSLISVRPNTTDDDVAPLFVLVSIWALLVDGDLRVRVFTICNALLHASKSSVTFFLPDASIPSMRPCVMVEPLISLLAPIS